VAGTIVPGGPVSGTWRKAEGPYTVTGDVHVPTNHTLTIEPGVVVRFAGHFGLTVGHRARLRAVGAEHDRIVLTATDPREGWFGLRFVSSGSDDILRYCTLEYGSKPRTGSANMADLFGGAIYCGSTWDNSPGAFVPSSPVIDSCVLSENSSRSGGAIACVDASEATITNCRIVGNYADYDGAGILLYWSPCTITNNVIAHNSGLVGGGIMNYLGTPVVANNTIVGNRPDAMYLDSTTMLPADWNHSLIANNIIWSNEIYMVESVVPSEYDIRFNDIQGGWYGHGNIDADPLFADAESGDFHLRSQAGRWDAAGGTWTRDEITSPCIDAGDPASDVRNEPHPSGGRLNLGAYGGTSEASKTP
jgi:predicted outer membrane repeat protein